MSARLLPACSASLEEQPSPQTDALARQQDSPEVICYRFPVSRYYFMPFSLRIPRIFTHANVTVSSKLSERHLRRTSNLHHYTLTEESFHNILVELKNGDLLPKTSKNFQKLSKQNVFPKFFFQNFFFAISQTCEIKMNFVPLLSGLIKNDQMIKLLSHCEAQLFVHSPYSGSCGAIG
jgi:hypothetical protein